MTVAIYGWCHKDRGREIVARCSMCGRAAYVANGAQVIRCDGCGNEVGECFCPDSRVAV